MHRTPWNAWGKADAVWFADLSAFPQTVCVGFGPGDDRPLVVSFGTPSFQACLKQLRADCEHLGVELYAPVLQPDPLDGVSERQLATRLKPRFVLSCLAAFSRPLWWVDADSRILAPPPPQRPGIWLGVHYQPKRKLYPIRSSTLYLAFDPRAFRLCAAWCAHQPQNKEDHGALVAAWNQAYPSAGIALLDCAAWCQHNGQAHPPGQVPQPAV